MALEESLKECCASLYSARATERKKNAETLKDFLSRNAVPSLLTENTLKRKGYTWNDVFKDVHDYVLKETEKLEASKNFETVIAPLCASLLHLTVSGANKASQEGIKVKISQLQKNIIPIGNFWDFREPLVWGIFELVFLNEAGKTYLNCDTILKACFIILKDKRLTKAVGNAYLGILYKCILPCDDYLGFITPAAWEELLAVTLSICISKKSKLDDFALMKLLHLVVKNGTSYCQFVVPLRDALSKLKIFFQSLLNDKKTQEILVEIMSLLLETLSSECRLTICNFTESMMTPILKCYDQNLDHKKKSSLFKLLLLTVKLHHPKGALQSNSCSMANDWTTWNKNLHSILEIVCLENTQKQRKTHDKSNYKENENYYSLAAYVYYQLFNILDRPQEMEGEQSSKRQRIAYNKNKSFSDLIEELSQNPVPWLEIINEFVKHFDSTISLQDYAKLLSVIDTLITDNNTSLHWNYLEELTCLVINNLTNTAGVRTDYDTIFMPLWNACVRTSTLVNRAHKALHSIMQLLLTTHRVKYANVQPLLKLYSENGMPVTDASINTLTTILCNFFGKCSSLDERVTYFRWITQGSITSADVDSIKDLLLKLLSSENVDVLKHHSSESNADLNDLHDILFNSIENSILFSEFELDISIPQSIENHNVDNVECNAEMDKIVQKYMETELSTCIEKIKARNMHILEYVKYLRLVLCYLDIKCKYNFSTREEIREEHIFFSIKMAFRLMYLSLINYLKSNDQDQSKAKVLKCLQEILTIDYDSMINLIVRDAVNDDFLLCINNIISAEEYHDDGETDETEMNPNTLRHAAICVLAAYCRRSAGHRDDILKLILDPALYNLSVKWDIDAAFECIKLLNSADVEDPPLESMFTLMQSMCRDSFRNPHSSFRILKVLIPMIDQIWWHDVSMRQNCLIMVKGYLMRCNNLYYSPKVAVLVYACAVKIVKLNFDQNLELECNFLDSTVEKVKGHIHSLRLFCSYLMRMIFNCLTDSEIESRFAGSMDIFVFEVSEQKELILKDELANRTLTILHHFCSLAHAKPSFIHKIITEVMQIQKEQSLNKQLVKKILNKITTMITNKTIEEYMNNNVLSILNCWFSKGNTIQQLPLYLFGFEQITSFIERHMKWLIAAEILWQKGGDVKDSETLTYVMGKSKRSMENIIEACICNIIVLCLPYIVVQVYKLDYTCPGNWEWTRNADKMYQSTREILSDEKWSCLFVENMSELVLLSATHISDAGEAARDFQVNIPEQRKSFEYPHEIFLAILKYMGKLIDENIMEYLCKSMSLIIFKTMFALWQNFLQENIFEFKVLCLHKYLTFLKSIPLGQPSDTFVCNFACNGFVHAIKKSKKKEEIVVLTKALKSVLERWLLEGMEILHTCVSQILSILMIKKEEGFEGECAQLLAYMTNDMKAYLQGSQDVVDFMTSLSQGFVTSTHCSKKEFLEKLNSFWKSLSCPSHETLLNMREFLKVNKHHVNKLNDDSNTKGFSDNCGSSIIHRIINALCNILKSESDNKTIIEACNCLSEIGNYDLKTLVTIPPSDTGKVTDKRPRQHLAYITLTALLDALFDENPAVTSAAAKTLKRLLKFRDGQDTIDLEAVDKNMLMPFVSSSNNITAEFKLNEVKFNSFFATGYWIPSSTETHSQWLTRITVALLEMLATTANYLSHLRGICLLKPCVCRKVLSSLMGVLLELSSEKHIKTISAEIDTFFKYIRDLNSDESQKNSHDKDLSTSYNGLSRDHKMTIQYMLEVVNFVRLQRIHYKPRAERTVKSLNYLWLDYGKVAWAASLADQNLAAIYYGELWAIGNNEGVPPSSPEAMAQLDGAGGESVQGIFRKCYVSIGELDAIEGCGTAHLTSEEERRRHLASTGQFADALLLHDIALSHAADRALQYTAVKTLHKSGLHHLALQYLKSLPDNDDLNDVKYDCLSFLGDWSDFVDTRELQNKINEPNCNYNSVLKAFRYSCLKDSINLQTTPEFANKLVLPINRAKLAVDSLCHSLNMENCQSVYKVLSKLHLFNDIEDYFSMRCDKLNVGELLSRWEVDKLPAYHDFKHLETLISQRNLMLENAAKSYNSALHDIVNLQLQYVEHCLLNQRVQMAERLLAVVKKLQSSHEVTLTESQILWAKGHKEIALSLLRSILLKPSEDVKLTAISLRQYGTWMAESKCDSARDIIDKYLKKSLEVLGDSNHEETRLKVYYDIAKFADAEYKQVVAYMNSSAFEKKVKCLETMKGTACSLRSTQDQLSKDEIKAMVTNEKFGQIDEAEIASTKAERESFLHLAMRYYLLSLKHDESNNLAIFRVISLWLDNPALELRDPEADSFEELLHAIPSRKYVTALPQLGPRLTNERTPFALNLNKIIKRCAIEHPHHTLPVLFSLKNSDKDKMILNASQKVGPQRAARAAEPRVTAAAALLSDLERSSEGMATVIAQMEKMCDAIISFANFTPQSKESSQKIPAAENIVKLGHLDAIPVPIDTITVSRECKYSHLPTLYSFENYFQLVGGINCPKKVICRSSDGKNRILLIKGQDDLRQDAVMQQVFNIVNTLLEKNPVTSRNKLTIRTYKVVPMSRRSGVLEWCEGTMPIGSYLVGQAGEQGAHVRYRPQDITPNVARAQLQQLYQKKKPNQQKLALFLRILREFRPVFHYFFTEHYLDPVTWFERRLAYTKSVAASSMVGYILGLGDRHLQNILIDKRTAEVVHIDFGIAFDQGKTLPTPETIPFRLTQDIVAGFGSSGVEGTFRRCCEKTMQLLRNNQETLLTLLEVLLCDPLYTWTVTSKLQKVPAGSGDTTINQSSGSDDSLAKRALLSVSSKLSGTEGGVAGGVAVRGQVARLIHIATDPVNLSRLFPGWQPYL